jgi:hypothetical protein
MGAMEDINIQMEDIHIHIQMGAMADIQVGPAPPPRLRFHMQISSS